MFWGRSGKFSTEVERAYATGDDIVREGEVGSQMYIVQSGHVAVLKQVGEREVEIAVLGKGDFFGEMSLLEGLPRSATVRALEATSVLVIEPGGFLLKIRRDPTLAFELLQQLSGRIRRLNEQIAESMLDNAQSADAVSLSMARSEFEAARDTAT
jgi:CRP/FNR family transcriptional regulator, cyclic AMP receptor protein